MPPVSKRVSSQPRPSAGAWFLLGLISALIVTASWPVRSLAQCAYWATGPLAGDLGPDGPVHAMTVWNDGTTSLLVVGGGFTQIGGVPANHIAAWDGTTWRPLALGVAGPVYSLTTWNGALIAGEVGQPSLTTLVQSYANGVWSNVGYGLGVAGDTVFTLSVMGPYLYAGGHFNGDGSPGSFAYHNIAAMGSIGNWGPLSATVSSPGGTNGTVYSLCTTNLGLYVGGAFSSADTVGVIPNIARWDGLIWYRVHDGTTHGPSEPVMALTAFGGNLFVGLDSHAIYGALEWNGSSWSTAGMQLGGGLRTFATYNGNLYAAGVFARNTGGPFDHIAQWSGTDWIAVGGGIDASHATIGGPPTVDALQVFGGTLVAGGRFPTAGATIVDDLASWNGTAWSNALSVTLDVMALSAYGSKLAVGGVFEENTATNGVAMAYDLVSWDGNSLAALGGAPDAPVHALRGYTSASGIRIDNNLLVVGEFTHLGGLAAPHVALWTESNVYPFQSWSTIGSGFDGTVDAFEFLVGSIVAGGAFLNSGAAATSHIARWNGTSWQPMSTGMNATVFGLKSYAVNISTSGLVAVGDFTTASGAGANHVAYWSQNNVSSTGGPWVPLGSGVNGSAYAVERFGGRVYIGGAFSASGATPVNNIAVWNGSSWVAVGLTPGGGLNGAVYALHADGAYLYAAGQFTLADGIAATNLARWDGTSWSAVDGGANQAAGALASWNGELVAGGLFDAVGATSLASPGVARHVQTGVPSVAQQPLSQTVAAGSPVAFSVQLAPGYTGAPAYRWRRNGVGLVDGPTGYGSTIGGSTLPSLQLTSTMPADSGFYYCLYSNSCGAESTVVAQLTVTYTLGVETGPSAGLRLSVSPNPAFGSADMEFSLANPGPVEADVFDERGARVRTLASGYMGAGPRHLHWDGHDDGGRAVRAGLYFVRVRAPGRSDRRKLVLVR